MTFPVGFRSETACPVVPIISLLSRLSIFPSLDDLRTSPFANGNLSKYLSQVPTLMTVTSRMIVDRRNLPPNPRKADGRSSAVNAVTIEEKHNITPKIPMIIPGNITSSEMKMIPASASIITNDINYFLADCGCGNLKCQSYIRIDYDFSVIHCRSVCLLWHHDHLAR